MDFRGKFFCSRFERGATAPCDEQCSECTVRMVADAGAQLDATEVPMKDRNVVPLKAVEAPAATGPQLVASISISLTDDGNLRVDGPFHDRILFHGLLEMARQYERDHAVATARNAAYQREQAKKEPFWKRKIREWNEDRARRAAEASKQPK